MSSGDRKRRSGNLPRLLLLAACLTTNGGCMLTRAVGRIGAQREGVDGPPRRVIVGDDGSVAFEVTTDVFRPSGKLTTQRTRYVVFDPPAVRAALERSDAAPPRPNRPGPAPVVFDPDDGRIVPHNPTAPDAGPEDLPEPLRPGRRAAEWRLPATPSPGRDMTGTDGTIPLDGRPRAVSLGFGVRDHRAPGATATAGLLIVPAVLADVITFPIQVPLFIYLYGSSFDRPSPR